MARVPLQGGAYTARSLIANAQRSVNLYSERTAEQEEPPTPVTLYPTPGLKRLGQASDLVSFLAFTVQPSTVEADATISPAVVVTAFDTDGKVIASFTNPVVLTLGANPGPGTLSGTLTVSAVAGVATFSDLSVDVAASGYTLVATSSAIAAGTSDPFDVTAVPAFVVDAVQFGAATIISNASLTAADSGDVSWSYWLKVTSPAPNEYATWWVDPIGTASADEIIFDDSHGNPETHPGLSDGGSNVLSANGVFTGSAWVNLKISARTNFAAGLKTIQIFAGDADITHNILDSSAAFINPFNGLPFFIGGDTLPNDYFLGDMAEFWWAPGQFIDWSVESNRRKFISAGGKPVDLGSDGSTPTGTAPAVYLSLRDTTPAHFATNRGTGGAFTVSAGSLTLASSSPSD